MLKIKKIMIVLLVLSSIASLTFGTASAYNDSDSHNLKSQALRGDERLENIYDSQEQVLQKEDTGDAVYRVQKCLRYMGYKIPDGPTEYFGPQTEAALKKFQQHCGFVANGILDQKTLRALDYYSKKKGY